MITEILYLRRPGDKEIISKMFLDLEKLNHEELIDAYTNLAERGLVAAHGQTLYLLAMRIAFLRLFESSPVKFEDNCILSIKTSSFSIKKRQAILIETKAKTDQEMLSQMLKEIRKFGVIKSEDIKLWWNNRY